MSNKVFTVEKFLGLNESADGTTELKLGEATVADNFYITDGMNLKSRPGVAALRRLKGEILAMWDGMIGKGRWTFLVYHREGSTTGAILVVMARNTEAIAMDQDGSFSTMMDPERPVMLLPFNDRIYLLGTDMDDSTAPRLIGIWYDGEDMIHYDEEAYVPLALTGCEPAGGGTVLESLNLLNSRMKLQYHGDGETAAYHLPDYVVDVHQVTVDGVEKEGSFDAASRVFTFAAAPESGVNNVEFLCSYFTGEHMDATVKLLSMRYSEAYNGSTDTRLFLYGDGTNVCYYTGTPTFGKGLYVPAGNEIAVDSSASAITGMCRHYTRLMVYKADSAYSVNYEPVTLADGRVTAGFYVRPASRAVGNDMDGQVQTVNNSPRTVCAGSLYEWRHTASYYQDERYAKRISEKICKTLEEADEAKIVTCDDNAARTYYMFLNDDVGTVLVERYDLGCWTVYTGEVFKDIRFAVASHGDILLAGKSAIFHFDPDSAYDAPVEADGEALPVVCRWESGYMAFGADYKRKYSSTLWVSMLPEGGSKMDITVKTDRRDEYLVKQAGLPLFSFSAMDFSNFSFLTGRAPKMQRVKIKVKKFVYYKLIFRVTEPGARATVLGYDQQVRYSANVK